MGGMRVIVVAFMIAGCGNSLTGTDAGGTDMTNVSNGDMSQTGPDDLGATKCTWSFTAPASNGQTTFATKSEPFPYTLPQCYEDVDRVTINALRPDGSFYDFLIKRSALTAGGVHALERGDFLYRLVSSTWAVQTICFSWTGTIKSTSTTIEIDANCIDQIDDMGSDGFASTIGQTANDVVIHGVVNFSAAVNY